MLYNKYRPQNAQELIGQDALAAFIRSLTPSSAPNCVLLVGGSGVGKTTAARVIAKKLNCTSPTPDGDVCGACESCTLIARGTYADVMEQDAASTGSADDIRRLVQMTGMMALYGGRRVVVLDEVQAMSKQAWQVLLKPLEENRTTTFILCTTEGDKVPAAVKTRALKFDLPAASRQDLGAALARAAQGEGYALNDEALGMLRFHAGESYREALTVLERVLPHARGQELSVDAINASGLMSQGEIDLYRELPRLLRTDKQGNFQVEALFGLVKSLPSAEEPQRSFLFYLYNLVRKRVFAGRHDKRDLVLLRECSRVLGDLTTRPTKHTIEYLLWTYVLGE